MTDLLSLEFAVSCPPLQPNSKEHWTAATDGNSWGIGMKKTLLTTWCHRSPSHVFFLDFASNAKAESSVVELIELELNLLDVATDSETEVLLLVDVVEEDLVYFDGSVEAAESAVLVDALDWIAKIIQILLPRKFPTYVFFARDSHTMKEHVMIHFHTQIEEEMHSGRHHPD